MSARKANINYSGRTVDLLLLKTVERPLGRQKVALDVSEDPKMVTGIEKMVQRFALAFVESAGSVKFDDSFGTEMVSRVGSGRVHDMPSWTSVAAEANMRARNILRREDEGLDTPDDEAIESSEITDLYFDRRTATVGVTILLRSRAGETFVYTIPVSAGI